VFNKTKKHYKKRHKYTKNDKSRESSGINENGKRRCPGE